MIEMEQENRVQLPAEAMVPLREPFKSSRRELLCALGSYVMAYAWTYFGNKPLAPLLVAAMLILLCEAVQKGTSRSRESLIWLGCLGICIFSLFMQEMAAYGIELGGSWIVKPMGFAPVDMAEHPELGTEGSGPSFCRVWDEGQLILFSHIFAVWWVLSRSGKLLKGESSRYLPMDGLNGFILIPFGNFFLRIRTLIYGIAELYKGLIKPGELSEDAKRGRKETAGWIVLALIISLVLFSAAGSMLSSADEGFSRIYSKLSDLLRLDLDLDEEIVLRLFFSIPVGMYLFGLIAGSRRWRRETLDVQLKGIEEALLQIRKVPEAFWTLVIGAFSLMYLVFFVIQGSYLFGAFTRTLPEGFIVSRYAREGFFELCKVIALNFSLLWLVTRMARPREEGASGQSGLKLFDWACLALLLESALFSVVAFSKIALYIDCFGFTPLRFQSIWLVCLLLAACIFWAVSLVSGKKVFRLWMYFGAVSLSLLSLY